MFPTVVYFWLFSLFSCEKFVLDDSYFTPYPSVSSDLNLVKLGFFLFPNKPQSDTVDEFNSIRMLSFSIFFKTFDGYYFHYKEQLLILISTVSHTQLENSREYTIETDEIKFLNYLLNFHVNPEFRFNIWVECLKLETEFLVRDAETQMDDFLEGVDLNESKTDNFEANVSKLAEWYRTALNQENYESEACFFELLIFLSFINQPESFSEYLKYLPEISYTYIDDCPLSERVKPKLINFLVNDDTYHDKNDLLNDANLLVSLIEKSLKNSIGVKRNISSEKQILLNIQSKMLDL
jgi:hypothetical protein